MKQAAPVEETGAAFLDLENPTLGVGFGKAYSYAYDKRTGLLFPFDTVLRLVCPGEQKKTAADCNSLCFKKV